MSEKKGYVMDDDACGRRDLEAGVDDTERAGRAPWRALFNFTTGLHILPLILALILSIASGIVIPALTVFLGKIFNEFTSFGASQISGHDLINRVKTYVVVLCGLGGASGILNGAYYGVWLIFGELQAKSAREKLFVGMLDKDMEWYDMRKLGIEPMVSRMQTQIRDLQSATSQPIGFAVQYTVTTVAALGLALYYSWSLTLVTLATIPFSAAVLAWISASMQPGVEAQLRALTEASKLANHAVSAIDTVKSFNGQDYEMWQYTKAVKYAAKCYLIQARANALQMGFVRLVTLGMFVQGFWFGTHLFSNGKKSSGDIVTAFMAALMAAQSVEQILPQLIVLEKGRAAGAMLKAIRMQIEQGRKIVKMIGNKKPSYCDGDIEIRNVSFSYPLRPAHRALDDVTLFFPAGETTFVVGRSGSGKSTLGNLLLRFYTPSSGDIVIDGSSIQTLDLKWLRNNITLVQQQSVLFNETIFKNIALGRQDHTNVRKEEVERSIDLALLRSVIQSLPQGLDTMAGFGGNAMSGGQKQRIALARARLRDTPILVLDEATSALDHLTKTSVIEAIREWRRGKTTIIITHDMSQVLDNDYAYVLEHGKIIQEGLKQTLEKASSGPFSNSLSRSIGSPQSPRQKPVFMKPSGLDEEEICKSDTLKALGDSVNSEIRPKKRPSSRALLPSRRQSGLNQKLINTFSTATTTTFPQQRTSISPSAFHRRKRKNVEHLRSAHCIELAKLSIEEVDQDRAPEPPRKEGYLQSRSIQSSKTSTRQKRFSVASNNVEETSRHNRGRNTEKKAGKSAPVRTILATVWPTLRWPQKIVLVAGFLSAAVHAAATPVFSWVFSNLLATFFLHDPTQRSQQALRWSISVLGVSIVDSIASYLMHYLLEYCSQAWIDALRIEALKRVLDQPRAWFEIERNRPARLTECLDRNAEEMRNLLGRFAGFLFVAVTMMTMAIIWSLVLNWKLTLAGIACAPVMYAITRSFEYISGDWEGKSNDTGSATNTIFTETFSNILTVRALTLEGYFHGKYIQATQRALKIGLKRSAFSGFFFGLSDSAILFVEALIFWYAAHLASRNAATTQNILTVLTMLLFSIANANAIVAFIPQINSSKSTATGLLRLAHLPYQNSDEHTGHVRVAHPGSIAFNSVSFTYPSRPTFPALSSLTLTLKPGRNIALAGASGGGKSTIASLLLGLYPPNTGNITVKNIPLRLIHQQTLRSLIAIVPQQPTLFPTTVADNIAYALPERSPLASLRNIRAAAQAAGIHDFIMSLPEKYKTRIGPGGMGLSGGQQQRIAIARAVVRRPRLLVLDEATSGLDRETAEFVRALVRRCRREGVGVLVIGHDRRMMECCEEVAVLKDGRIVETGAFGRLMRREGGELRQLLGEGGK